MYNYLSTLFTSTEGAAAPSTTSWDLARSDSRRTIRPSDYRRARQRQSSSVSSINTSMTFADTTSTDTTASSPLATPKTPSTFSERRKRNTITIKDLDTNTTYDIPISPTSSAEASPRGTPSTVSYVEVESGNSNHVVSSPSLDIPLILNVGDRPTNYPPSLTSSYSSALLVSVLSESEVERDVEINASPTESVATSLMNLKHVKEVNQEEEIESTDANLTPAAEKDQDMMLPKDVSETSTVHCTCDSDASSYVSLDDNVEQLDTPTDALNNAIPVQTTYLTIHEAISHDAHLIPLPNDSSSDNDTDLDVSESTRDVHSTSAVHIPLVVDADHASALSVKSNSSSLPSELHVDTLPSPMSPLAPSEPALDQVSDASTTLSDIESAIPAEALLLPLPDGDDRDDYLDPEDHGDITVADASAAAPSTLSLASFSVTLTCPKEQQLPAAPSLLAIPSIPPEALSIPLPESPREVVDEVPKELSPPPQPMLSPSIQSPSTTPPPPPPPRIPSRPLASKPISSPSPPPRPEPFTSRPVMKRTNSPLHPFTAFHQAIHTLHHQLHSRRLKEIYLSREWIRLALALPIGTGGVYFGRTKFIAQWYDWRATLTLPIDRVEAVVEQLRELRFQDQLTKFQSIPRYSMPHPSLPVQYGRGLRRRNSLEEEEWNATPVKTRLKHRWTIHRP
ncbi:hypothetical protein BZG36_03706 [Bifiguratus adelaidae]|uniref:Uncharacterized protein n=1 Tax=Bifiguratus adelaidae TaxID=1938954 RepID=A0A261XXF1_9FUNG|nr:hypothetical protein BZG36_03706 [Bifiguratus adelaidae]